ncbi:MAG: hypothetical protein ACHQ2E_12180 [Gemmatimonadales bacterium]
MADLHATWTKLLADLERERDELRLKAHLGKAEARDHLARAEQKIEEFRQKAPIAKGVARDAAGQVEASAKALAGEIREAFARVRGVL